jgi:hypothetical protein
MEDKINICILDFQQEDLEKVKNKGFEVFNGSAGTKVEVSYSGNTTSKYCLLKYDYPSNLHEYNILVVNMISDQVVPYAFEDHQRKKVSTDGETKLEVSHPTNVFDPRPLSYQQLDNELVEFIRKPSILVVFADKAYETTYQPVHFRSGGYPKDLEKVKKSNYSFWPNIPLRSQKHGLKSNVVANGVLKKLLQDFNELEYHQTFYIEQIWSDEEGKSIQDPNFHPLIENNSNEVIAYAYSYENTVLFIFPDIKNKGEFTSRLLTEIAPQILPDLFSYNNEINWLNDEKYWLPAHEQLIQNKNSEIERHKNALIKIEKSIESNIANYKFLHDLITETDDKLVESVLTILKYIGFESAKNVDETKEDRLLEEDIQLELEGKLLVIEVKGIGGTSKDNECSQISKIRLRRMKEKKSTEVYGLYIVNHERFKPPHMRSNPPFNDTQIQDAINDDRGLLTTWDLYKLYFDIENGIILKDEIQECFFQFGLVNFRKDFVQVAKVDKVYKDGNVASFELAGKELRIEDIIISEKDGYLKKHKIKSIQKNKTNVDFAKEGRTGILIDTPLEVNSIIYKKGSS